MTVTTHAPILAYYTFKKNDHLQWRYFTPDMLAERIKTGSDPFYEDHVLFSI
jgi:hypothetical protein